MMYQYMHVVHLFQLQDEYTQRQLWKSQKREQDGNDSDDEMVDVDLLGEKEEDENDVREMYRER